MSNSSSDPYLHGSGYGSGGGGGGGGGGSGLRERIMNGGKEMGRKGKERFNGYTGPVGGGVTAAGGSNDFGNHYQGVSGGARPRTAGSVNSEGGRLPMRFQSLGNGGVGGGVGGGGGGAGELFGTVAHNSLQQLKPLPPSPSPSTSAHSNNFYPPLSPVTTVRNYPSGGFAPNGHSPSPGSSSRTGYGQGGGVPGEGVKEKIPGTIFGVRINARKMGSVFGQSLEEQARRTRVRTREKESLSLGGSSGSGGGGVSGGAGMESGSGGEGGGFVGEPVERMERLNSAGEGMSRSKSVKKKGKGIGRMGGLTVVLGKPLIHNSGTNTPTISVSDPASGVGVPGTGRQIPAEARPWLPAIVVRCLEYLDLWGPTEEGIYRVPGRQAQVSLLKYLFDSGADADLRYLPPTQCDPHAVASVFKLWLRELPDPILTDGVENDVDIIMLEHTGIAGTSRNFLTRGNGNSSVIFRAEDPLPRALIDQLATTLTEKLPPENWFLLRELASHLGYLSANPSKTKMTLNNLRLILSPTLRLSPLMLQILVEERTSLFAVYPESLKYREIPPSPASVMAGSGSAPNSPAFNSLTFGGQQNRLYNQRTASGSSLTLPDPQMSSSSRSNMESTLAVPPPTTGRTPIADMFASQVGKVTRSASGPTLSTQAHAAKTAPSKPYIPTRGGGAFFSSLGDIHKITKKNSGPRLAAGPTMKTIGTGSKSAHSSDTESSKLNQVIRAPSSPAEDVKSDYSVMVKDQYSRFSPQEENVNVPMEPDISGSANEAVGSLLLRDSPPSLDHLTLGPAVDPHQRDSFAPIDCPIYLDGIVDDDHDDEHDKGIVDSGSIELSSSSSESGHGGSYTVVPPFVGLDLAIAPVDFGSDFSELLSLDEREKIFENQ